MAQDTGRCKQIRDIYLHHHIDTGRLGLHHIDTGRFRCEPHRSGFTPFFFLRSLDSVFHEILPAACLRYWLLSVQTPRAVLPPTCRTGDGSGARTREKGPPGAHEAESFRGFFPACPPQAVYGCC